MTLDTILTNDDLLLFNRGENFQAYKKMGAHLVELNGKRGVHFALWAPHAKEVIVRHFRQNRAIEKYPLQPLEESGIWFTLVEGMQEGDMYKFIVKTVDGSWVEKIDPFGFAFEVRPNRAAIVYDIDKFKWTDDKWIENRKNIQGLDKPMSVYSMHAGSWKRKADEKYTQCFLTYDELREELIPYLLREDVTHVEFRPLFEHALDISWGYQTTGFFALTSRFGTPEQFQQLINALHENDIGGIMDVGMHFPKDEWGLSFFDGTPLYEPEHLLRAEIPDWGTKRFDFDKPGVRSFLSSSICMLIDVYHIDAIRFDGMAYMLFHDHGLNPGNFLLNPDGTNENWDAVNYFRHQNKLIADNYPGIITIAELAAHWDQCTAHIEENKPRALGFTLQQDLGFSKNVVEFFMKDPIDRKFFMNNRHLDIAKPKESGEILTYTLSYAFKENYMLPLPHDLFVHGKSSLLNKMLLYQKQLPEGEQFLDEYKFANVRLLWLYQYGHPGKKLNHMGSEIGQRTEWNCLGSVEWELLQHMPHQALQKFFEDLNHFYRRTPALYELDHTPKGFEWIDCMDSDNTVLSFIRHARNKKRNPSMIFIFNFTAVTRNDYRIGVNEDGFYKEALNTDSIAYGGRGRGNNEGVFSEALPMHNRNNSISLTLPGYTGLVFYQTK